MYVERSRVNEHVYVVGTLGEYQAKVREKYAEALAEAKARREARPVVLSSMRDLFPHAKPVLTLRDLVAA